ncbi:unnamed protein product [Mytilus coruscus]|uniref:Uncharacterized protein n=1 Tax=Mytilus coruscus TaxID=42192 RepID=A0A6J8BB29_MYTCO|nr:unnamed protein product [Mytilus coruscus]
MGNEKDNFFRFICLITEVVADVLRYRLKQSYRNSNLQIFLKDTNVLHTIFHLFFPAHSCCWRGCRTQLGNVFSKKQWDILYDSDLARCCKPNQKDPNKICMCCVTSKNVDESDLDLSLLSLILINCCNLMPNEKEAIQKIREMKNDHISHNPNCSLSNLDFESLMNTLGYSIKHLDSTNIYLNRYENVLNRPMDESLMQKYFVYCAESTKIVHLESEIKVVNASIHRGNENIIQAIQDLKSDFERHQRDANMTEGELPTSPKEPNNHYIEQEQSARRVQDALNNLPPNIIQGGHQLQTICSGPENFKDRCTCSYSYSDEAITNEIGDHQINIAEYVQSLSDKRVRKQLAKALSTDEPNDSLDIENMDHYLFVAKRSNLRNTLKCCENKLISNLSALNCVAYYKLAEKYELSHLQVEALGNIKKTQKSDQFSIFTNQNNNCSIKGCELCNRHCDKSSRGSLESSRTKNYNEYYSLFTVCSCGSKRTITTIVYDSNMRNRCYRDIKKGNKISKLFQCCCIQGDENVPPIIYWSFGSSVYQYDPLLNKCKKRASLNCKRAKFNMISHGKQCYVIGGVYMSRKVLAIEEYNTKKNSWKKVAYLPGEAYPINPTCVAYNDLIYVFSAILDIEDEIKPSATAVYVFHLSTKIVKKLAEIPLSFNQMKTCVVGSFIYIASDEKRFIRFSPSQGSYFSLPDQMQECKDFGMFTKERSIVLAGGYCGERKCKDIHVFCSDSGHWETLSEKLPDNMAIYGACELKIPNSAGTIVPFYETNLFEKR